MTCVAKHFLENGDAILCNKREAIPSSQRCSTHMPDGTQPRLPPVLDAVGQLREEIMFYKTDGVAHLHRCAATCAQTHSRCENVTTTRPWCPPCAYRKGLRVNDDRLWATRPFLEGDLMVPEALRLMPKKTVAGAAEPTLGVRSPTEPNVWHDASRSRCLAAMTHNSDKRATVNAGFFGDDLVCVVDIAEGEAIVTAHAVAPRLARHGPWPAFGVPSALEKRVMDLANFEALRSSPVWVQNIHNTLRVGGSVGVAWFQRRCRALMGSSAAASCGAPVSVVAFVRLCKLPDRTAPRLKRLLTSTDVGMAFVTRALCTNVVPPVECLLDYVALKTMGPVEQSLANLIWGALEASLSAGNVDTDDQLCSVLQKRFRQL